MPKATITCEELKDQLSNPKLVLLDASFDKEGKINFADEFKKSHIANSYYFDFKRGTEKTEYLLSDLPKSDIFEEYVRSFGINNDSLVVVYDVTPDAGGFLGAGRTWFQFQYFGLNNIRVLEGGMQRWRFLGYDVTSDESPSPVIGNFLAKEHKNKRVDFDEISDIVSQGSCQIIDCRPPPVFQKGHIPNAINVPLGSFINRENWTMPSPGTILDAFKNKGIDISKPIIASCNSGNAGAGLACIGAIAGLDMRLYVGSYYEWSNRREKEN